jgi:hypothetical protein
MPARPPARCMFCDALGVTHAHIIAESFTKLFDDPDDPLEYEVVHEFTDPVTRDKREIKRARTFALTTRKVCGPCNSGWLNRLEDAVRPTMAAFARDTPVTLDAEEQDTLALWAAAATLGYLSKETEDEFRFASPELARELYETGRPQAGMQLWVGANSHGHLGWFGSHSLHLGHGPRRADLWGATLAFGFGVLHTVFHGLDDRRLRLHYDVHRSLRSICPAQPNVAWQPPLVMNPRDLSPLAILVEQSHTFTAAS